MGWYRLIHWGKLSRNVGKKSQSILKMWMLMSLYVMPNHILGIILIHEKDKAFVWAQHAAPIPTTASASRRGITPDVKPGSLGAIVRSFKSAVARHAGIELNSGTIWQRYSYEHIIHNQADYERIAAYILTNPANWDQDEENPLNPECLNSRVLGIYFFLTIQNICAKMRAPEIHDC